MPLKGAFKASMKNGTEYYRSSITYRNKHISLGSFEKESDAHEAYLMAKNIITDESITIDSYTDDIILDFEKYISLINFRNNKMYFKNPIYLERSYFNYYLSPSVSYKFDIDDLFFYAGHKISQRGNHLFYADYGMQINLMSRYGIKSHAVLNRDYRFINGDRYDFRYANIEIINRYNGVRKHQSGIYTKYTAKILVNGLYTIGTYASEVEAAIAYNKAADIIKKKHPGKNFRLNYIDNLNPKEYARIYLLVHISDRIYSDFKIE